MTQPQREPGLIVANYGRHFLVENDADERLICHSRGKKSQGVVGDRVLWLASQDEGTIEKIEPRRNLFYRQDDVRTKMFAANLDQVLILIAAEPEFSSSQLSRALIAAEEQHITPIIVLNKSDLTEPFARAWNWLAPYRHMGYDVLSLSLADAAAGRAALSPRLTGKTTLVLGPSGAGKSTLINCLIPGALVQTGVLSQALSSG
ncbi:MAG TPA: ribosome small subunit-dependent GTPase A, partial [Rhodoferax sp.]|nr:ribosome small subunit-dependent GTPase A [Rhodoferax sp.]